MILLLVISLFLHLLCQACPANCDSCIDSYSCSTCSSGYSLSSDGSSCNSDNGSLFFIIFFSIAGFIIIMICFYKCRLYYNQQPPNYEINNPNNDQFDQANRNGFNVYWHNNQVRATQTNFNRPFLASNVQWQNIAYNESFQHQSACVICLCKAVNVRTHCGHGFHSNCIEAWFKARPNCPTCRAEIDNVILFCSTCYQRCKRLSLRVTPNIQEYATVCNTCMQVFT